MTIAAFGLTIFAGAFLLFLVQPMAGKALLPLLGGSPSVWNTCMVFYQVMLLAGYAYAHLLGRTAGRRAQVLVHAGVLAGAVLVLAVTAAEPPGAPGDAPIAWLLLALLGSIGLPFFALSAGAPLLQKWFAATDHRAAGDPYFLYAGSNFGSLVALLAYPLLVEPLLGLGAQRAAWAVACAVYALLVVGCGVLLLARPGREPVTAGPLNGSGPGWREHLWWAALAFVPSSLMLGTTRHITTDVAAVPLLWVAPLAIYLLTYVAAFARRPPVRPRFASGLLVLIAVAALAMPAGWTGMPVAGILAVHLVLLLVAGLVCHGRLAEGRPHPRHLTSFFVAVAAGGALGGAFNALLAPAVFDRVIEYPLMIVAAVLLRHRWRGAGRAARRWVNATADAAVIAAAVAGVPLSEYAWIHRTLEADRSFFGVHRVTINEQERWVGYVHGTTVHGLQLIDDRGRPVSYYHDGSGIGRLFEVLGGDPRLDDVAVVGLGIGTIGVWCRPGQRYTFYEIDPAVVAIARDQRYFTFLRDMPEPPRIVLGDGRLGLAGAADGAYGLVVLDAFTSDAVPTHLLTVEAVRLYFDKLADGGLLAVNASNRHVRLERLCAGLARALGLVAVTRPPAVGGDGAGDDAPGVYAARWVVLARDAADLGPLAAGGGWETLAADEATPVWTDDYSNLLGLLRWLP